MIQPKPAISSRCLQDLITEHAGEQTCCRIRRAELVRELRGGSSLHSCANGRCLLTIAMNIQEQAEKHHCAHGERKRQVPRNCMIRSASQILAEKFRSHEYRNQASSISNNREHKRSREYRSFLPHSVELKVTINRSKHRNRH